ncbi:hypothetical protein IL306_008944 [Fusarium sp. DS 682]|nr:hypothetical protein IL306_008944 [Fusarium sp. DS 682]
MHGDERMGHVLFRFIKYIKANRRLTKGEYQSKRKTVHLRKKAERAIASVQMRYDSGPVGDRRAEHKHNVNTNMLGCMIDISNSLRVLAECTVHQHNVNGVAAIVGHIQMPARCGPKELPEDCIWNLPSDEEN